jgi:hypothetical protein
MLPTFSKYYGGQTCPDTMNEVVVRCLNFPGATYTMYLVEYFGRYEISNVFTLAA